MDETTPLQLHDLPELAAKNLPADLSNLDLYLDNGSINAVTLDGKNHWVWSDLDANWFYTMLAYF